MKEGRRPRRVAVERELRDDQDVAAGVQNRAIHVPGVVGEDAEVEHLVRQHGNVVLAVPLAHPEEHEQPRADAAHGRAFHPHRGLGHPLHHRSHAREGYYTPACLLR